MVENKLTIGFVSVFVKENWFSRDEGREIGRNEVHDPLVVGESAGRTIQTLTSAPYQRYKEMVLSLHLFI